MTHPYGETTSSNIDDHAVFGNQVLVCEILSRLPVESLETCKSVCRSWQSLIHKNQYLVNLHVNRSIANHNPSNSGLLFVIGSPREKNLQLFYGEYEDIERRSSLDAEFSYRKLLKIKHPFINKRQFDGTIVNTIIGSCNGLVCFSIPHLRVNDPVYICNPITGEYANLPRLNYISGLVVSGFGYHLSSNEYKVVRIFYPDRCYHSDPVKSKGCVQVYTLGSGTGWRNIGEITYALSRSCILANGSLYWFDRTPSRIVVFDLGHEEFRFLPCVPQCFHHGKRAKYELKELGGYLCYIHMELGNRVDIWSYKQISSHENTEEGWSWSLDLSIACPAYSDEEGNIFPPQYKYVPFALTENNEEVLLWLNGSGLSCYDKKTDTLRTIVGEDYSLSTHQGGVPHMNTLVSLKALGERSKTRKVMKEIKTKKKMRERKKLHPISENEIFGRFRSLFVE